MKRPLLSKKFFKNQLCLYTFKEKFTKMVLDIFNTFLEY